MLGLSLTPFGWLLVGSYVTLAVIVAGCVCCDTDEGPFATAINFVTEDIPAFIGRGLRAVLGERIGGAIAGGGITAGAGTQAAHAPGAQHSGGTGTSGSDRRRDARAAQPLFAWARSRRAKAVF